MKRAGLVLTILACAAVASAQSVDPAIHIPPTGDGFDVYLAAALSKKHVPARIVDVTDAASLTLKSTQVAVRKDATRVKVMKCLFNSCDGIDGDASVSVQLVDRHGTIVWSYAVNRDGDDSDRKSMAEAIAKRLKKDYFKR
jgi:cobalamin-dependent methionine synthase I